MGRIDAIDYLDAGSWYKHHGYPNRLVQVAESVGSGLSYKYGIVYRPSEHEDGGWFPYATIELDNWDAAKMRFHH